MTSDRATNFPVLLLAAALAAAAWAGTARAQFLDAGGGGGPSEVDDDGDEGLQSATPTDNVNELNSGGGPGNVGGDGGGVDDFPAANGKPEQFDVEGTDGGDSDDFFGNGADGTDGGGGGTAIPSAFGDDPPAAGAPPAGGTPPATTPPPAAAPANPPPPANLLPANTPPVNAQSLMNQITTEPAVNPTAPAPAPVNPAAPVDPTATVPAAAGDQELVQQPAEPVIEAPPLPPPNEFSGAPPVPGTMRLMAEGEAPEEYVVQPGDTLFDICDQLLDEASYWPKLWALNPEIKNPHFIFPNMRLKFYPGDDETPPYLQVVTEDDVIPIDKGELDEQELVAEKVVFPTEEEALAEETVEVIGPGEVDPLEDELEMGGRIYDGSEITVQVPGFIFAERKEPLGYVIGGRSGEINLQPTGMALIEGTGNISAGTLYTVVRAGEEIEDPDTGDFVGYKYYFIANIRIDRSLDDDVYTGTVQENARLGVREGDIVVDFISTVRTLPTTADFGAVSGAPAFVVGFQYEGQEIGGAGSYAFVNKGNGDGVSAGMYLPVYSTPGFLARTTFGDADLPEDYQLIGVMRIIDTTDAGAVGYVLRNTQEIRVGDRTDKGG